MLNRKLHPLIPLVFAGFVTSKAGKQLEWGGPCVEPARGSAHASTLPRMSGLGRHSAGLSGFPVSEGLSGFSVQVLTTGLHLVGGHFLADLAGTDTPPPVPARTKNLTENLLLDHQVCEDVAMTTSSVTQTPVRQASARTAAPPPGKPKPPSSCGTAALFTPTYSTGTFPGKLRPAGGQRRVPGLLQSYTLPLPAKQEIPPAAAVRPYAPDLSDPPPTLQKPPTVATSSIYSMYTQQVAPGKAFQLSGQGTLPRRRPRGASSVTGSDPVRTGAFNKPGRSKIFCLNGCPVSPTVYGKPVLPASEGQRPVASCVHDGMEADGSCSGPSEAGGETADRPTPRPLSPTKLLPFLSNPHRNPSDVDLEALRRRLHHAPRPLKKRSSITEPEGPAGPNIQKLLYQKTTLAAMETVPMETLGNPQLAEDENFSDLQPFDENQDDNVTPPPLPPRCPAPCRSLLPPLEGDEEAAGRTSPVRQEHQTEEFPPYPPPPYPSCGESEQGADVIRLPPPEVAGQLPPVSPSAEDSFPHASARPCR